MDVYFLDRSALVKRYVAETGSRWVIGLTDPLTDNRIYVARIAGVEVTSAFKRLARDGSLSAPDAVVAIRDFRFDFANQYRIVELTPALVTRAMSLAETRTLKAYDAIQLAAGIEVNSQRVVMGLSALIFISADIALNEVATAEGLTVDDPNLHP